MAKYHPLFAHIWSDPDFELLSPEDKLLFIYLFSNASVTESGIYQKSPKKISDETGIGLTTVVQRLSNGCFKNIKYDIKNNIVLVKNARKYNTGGSPKLIEKSVWADRKAFPDTYLWHIFEETNPEYEGIANGCPTVVQPYDSDCDTDSNTTKGSLGNPIEVTTTTTTAREEMIKTIFKNYESNIEMITPILSDNLKLAIEEYPEDWINDAIKEAVNSNIRKWRYIEKILLDWKSKGRGNGNGKHRGNNQPTGNGKDYTGGKYGRFVQS